MLKVRRIDACILEKTHYMCVKCQLATSHHHGSKLQSKMRTYTTLILQKNEDMYNQ